MPDFSPMGKTLLALGGLLMVLGAALTFSGKVPLLGRLPGDFHWQGRDFSFYFPAATCLLLSLLFSITLWFISKFK